MRGRGLCIAVACLTALFGLVASYHGLLYGASRQLFALGRAGFLPPAVGTVSPSRQTPVAALVAWCDHRSALRAIGVKRREFFRAARAECIRFLDAIRPVALPVPITEATR